MKHSALAGSLLLASLLIAGEAVARVDDNLGRGPGTVVANPLADAVRNANDRYQDVAAAVAAGYAPIPCDSAPSGGGMGIHYVNQAYLKDVSPDVARPQALMYEPEIGGKRVLIAAEYITFKGPASLDGHLLNFTGAPNSYGLDPFYELHVWAWKTNPRGTFADDNPNVSCDAMPLAGK